MIEGINGLNGTIEGAVEGTKELNNVLNDTMEHVNILGEHLSKFEANLIQSQALIEFNMLLNFSKSNQIYPKRLIEWNNG